jgi:GNAT superfamily N-acetyltransferase
MTESVPCLQTPHRRRARATPSRSGRRPAQTSPRSSASSTALAEFEKLTHLVQVTPESLAPHLFGDRPVAEALVAERAGRVVAFALFFTNFSTFLALPGLYLEDLFVEPEARGQGIGQALLEHLAQLAATRGCGRFEWSVLDWNEGAIRFYQRMGATVMPDWRICRIAGPALAAFADPPRG